MNCSQAIFRPLSGWIVVFGSLLAVASAFEPEPTGAWHLAGAYLVCGLIPYIVYGSFMDILGGCTLVIAGGLLLAADLFARFDSGITAGADSTAYAAIWLSLILTGLVLPLGMALGKLFSRLPS